MIRLGVLTLGVCLLGFAGLSRAGGQTATTQSHVVAVKSDPPGAMIWQKEGRDYTCTNTVTPGTIELTFHGDNDVQKLRVRRFGYSDMNLDVKLTDQEIDAVLGQLASKSFLVADDAASNLKQLNAALKKEFDETLLPDQNAFRCAPFDLDFIQLVKDKETGAAELDVVLRLDHSFGGPAFRLASHAPNTPERSQKMGRAALEGGIAEILGRFHRLAAEAPDLKVIAVLGSYATTQATLDTITTPRTFQPGVTTITPIIKLGADGMTYRAGTRYTTTPGRWSGGSEITSVKDDLFAEKTITFVMPAAQIPDTLDKKAITDAVLAVGKILTGSLGE